MARIAPADRASAPEYRDLRTQSASLRENNDCAVIAVAAATGRPYAEVHAMFTEEGRKPGRGTRQFITAAVISRLGFIEKQVVMRDIIARYPGAHSTLRNVTTHHPARFPKAWADGRTYLLRTRGHILCVKNGVNLDWTRGRALRVIWMTELVKKD